jgi:hypothetical protein
VKGNFSKSSHFGMRHALVVVATITLSSTSGFALGTEEERAACTPDVFRLCSSEIPNIPGIIACLKKQKPNLSAGCRTAVNNEEGKIATRSLMPAEFDWCSFGSRIVDPALSSWFKWCGSDAHGR